MRTALIATLLLLFTLCTAQYGCQPRSARSATIVVTSNSGNNEWWIAYSVSDDSTTSVELKDAGAYSEWTKLESTNWGYWTFAPQGSAVTFPVSLRISKGDKQITLPNIFLNAAPGAFVDTKLTYDNGAPSETPSSPTTQAPAQPTQAPAQPTQAPAQPTQAPAQPTTQAPAKPTQAPAQPTQPPATQAPTSRPTEAPSRPTPPTQAPTKAPSNPPPAPPSAPSGGNPFKDTKYYLNPHYLLEVDSSIASNPSLSTKLAKVKDFASAFWIDRMSVIDNVTTILTQARLQATQSGKQVMAAIVVYDLPARDCAAAASNGEIQCADADCVEGINTYKTRYIDEIAKVLRNFPDLTIVLIIEPDSLPNLATNIAVPKCQIAHDAYITCVAYAIEKLSALGNTHLYVDAAHGGWLGWETGRTVSVQVFKEVLDLAGGASKIRGFATNVANYQPLGSMTDTADPCGLATQYNFAINEVKYVSMLDASLKAVGINGMHYIIDTGRNGVIDGRADCSNWCNIKNAGLGKPPTSDTASSGLDIIDAYFWVKPPGESDGTSNTQATRYDFHCGSSDSRLPAPEAGAWFSEAFVAMAQNANPAL